MPLKDIKQKNLIIMIYLMILFLFFGCNKNKSIVSINKTTIITYLGGNNLRCETILLIPKGIYYNVRSDGLCGGLELINISVSKNGVQLPPNNYSMEDKFLKNIYNPIYGHIDAIYKSIIYKSTIAPSSQIDSIHFSYDISVGNPPDSLKKSDFIQLFLSESFPSTDPIVEVNSQLIQRTLDDNFIPRQRLRQGMKIDKGDRKYEQKYSWEIKSDDLSHSSLSPYQAIGFTRNIYQYIGEISQTLDLSKTGVVKEYYVSMVKGGSKKNMK